jgi:serine/threonine protein kinase
MQKEAALSKHGDRLANLEYAAPEQLIPGEKANEATDIFSLGLLLYRIFTGTVPRGANPKQISTAAPQYPYLDDIANAMIQDERARRPQSIAEIKQQKLDELKRRVIPTSELSDPLIDDPIQIVASDWNNDQLVLTLSQAPNQSWITTLQNLGAFSSIGPARPRSVSFQGREARIPAPERNVESAFQYARNWIQQTNANCYTPRRRIKSGTCTSTRKVEPAV